MLAPLSSHDEPFVIDNFPLAIDLGRDHAGKTDKGSDKEWIRKQTLLDSILILEKSPEGAKEFKTDRLDLAHPVTIELDGAKSLSLQLDNVNELLTLDPSVELVKNGRRMKQQEGGDRIVLIKWRPVGSARPVTHRPDLQPLSTVYVVLFKSDPTPHAIKNRRARKRPKARART